MKRLVYFTPVSCVSPFSPTDGVESKSNVQLTGRSNLPLYSEVPAQVEKSIEEKANSTVLEAVRNFRKETLLIAQTVSSVTTRCETFVNTGIAHSYGSYINAAAYLREEKNLLPRFGAITGGFFFGYIISFRKGFFRRIIYTTSSAAIIASICYPSEAKLYACKSLQSSKKYATIGFHFLNGVTKDLGGFELPTSLMKLVNSEETTKKDMK